MRKSFCALALLAFGVTAAGADKNRRHAHFRRQVAGGLEDARWRRRLQGGRRHHRRLLASRHPQQLSRHREGLPDFILEFDVRQDVGPTNSGVQFRSLSTPDFENGRVHGYQVDIDPSARQWSGGIYEEAQRGWFYTGEMNPPAKALYKFGEWNHYRIEAIGPRLRVWINDGPAADVIDDVTKEGFFGLQVHSINTAEEAGRTTSWKNLRVQTKNLKPMPPMGIFIRNNLPNNLDPEEKAQGWRLLWDGKTTRGWRSANAEGFPAKGWSLANGELAVRAEGRRRRHHDRRGIRRLRTADGVQGLRRRQQRHLLSTDLAERSGERRAARARIPDPRRRAASGCQARHRRQSHASLRCTTSIRAPSS